MEVKELIEKLNKVNQNLNVVVDITVNDELTAWSVNGVDLGWEPSGVISLTVDKIPVMS